MTDEVIEILESAAERYAEDVCREVERVVFLTPPERESYKKIISNGYFCGAYELWEVLKESNNPTNKTPR
jgi:hypothetical protein